MSADKAKELGITPLGQVVGYGMVAGPDTSLLTQPSRAIAKAAKKAGIDVGAIDLFEINEAFAAVGLASADELGIDEDKINVNGGAIALGHPVGMSGTRVALSALLELRRRGGRHGGRGPVRRRRPGRRRHLAHARLSLSGRRSRRRARPLAGRRGDEQADQAGARLPTSRPAVDVEPVDARAQVGKPRRTTRSRAFSSSLGTSSPRASACDGRVVPDHHDRARRRRAAPQEVEDLVGLGPVQVGSGDSGAAGRRPCRRAPAPPWRPSGRPGRRGRPAGSGQPGRGPGPCRRAR